MSPCGVLTYAKCSTGSRCRLPTIRLWAFFVKDFNKPGHRQILNENKSSRGVWSFAARRKTPTRREQNILVIFSGWGIGLSHFCHSAAQSGKINLNSGAPAVKFDLYIIASYKVDSAASWCGMCRTALVPLGLMCLLSYHVIHLLFRRRALMATTDFYCAEPHQRKGKGILSLR